MELAVVLLHRYPELMQQCCDLVNSEWKRSDAARMRSLEASTDNLPTCLILMGARQRVIGHCKLTAVPNDRHVCFVESVVIDKELRGQGHGSYLMRKTEEYCKDALCLRRIYLSTKGQEEFYAKLGYRECGPISIYGSITRSISPVRGIHIEKRGRCVNFNENDLISIPEPPPLPRIYNSSVVRKTFMYKDLID